jgi:glycosyltransferase involved in cell wall biosynthesis
MPLPVPHRGIGRKLGIFAFGFRLLALAVRLRPNVIYVHDFYLPLIGLLAASALGARLVYDAHELIIPEHGERLGLRDMIFYQGERLSIKHADLIIAANQERAAFMQDHYHLKATPTVVRNIPPAPNATSATDVPATKQTEQAPQTTRIVYQGDISLARGVGNLIRAMTLMPDEFVLLLVGGGVDLERVQSIVGELALEGKVVTCGKIPRAELHALLETCDIGVVTYSGRGLNNFYCAPNKVFEYAQAGLPIVATNQPPLKALVDEYEIGRVVEPDGPIEELAAALKSVATNIEAHRSRLSRFLRENQWADEALKLQEAFGHVVGCSRRQRPARSVTP